MRNSGWLSLNIPECKLFHLDTGQPSGTTPEGPAPPQPHRTWIWVARSQGQVITLPPRHSRGPKVLGPPPGPAVYTDLGNEWLAAGEAHEP